MNTEASRARWRRALLHALAMALVFSIIAHFLELSSGLWWLASVVITLIAGSIASIGDVREAPKRKEK